MRDTDYAFGVAKIRYNELSLLTAQETEQLISCDGVGAVLGLLSDKGWDVSVGAGESSAMLEKEADKAWDLLKEAAPDINVLNALIMPDDFHNLKAALKCLLSSECPDNLFVYPSITPPDLVFKAVSEKLFDTLPVHLAQAAKQGYESAMLSHGAGRLIDIVVDRFSMEERIKSAVKSKVRVLEETARLSCAAANIKIALRSAATGKDAEFMQRAMAESGLINNADLIESAQKGRAEVASYISTTVLSDAAVPIGESDTAFEKWCDEAVFDIISAERSSAFGAGPLAAYYMSKIIEIKNVRIIISAKNNNLPEESIRKRVRKAYV